MESQPRLEGTSKDGESQPSLGSMSMRVHEARVRLRACTLDEQDLKMRNHEYPEFLPPSTSGSSSTPLPPIGYAGSGVIDQVGSEASQQFTIGQEVVVFIPWNSTYGGCAEYTIQPTINIFPKPANLSHEDACASLWSGVQAFTSLHYQLRVKPGDRLLLCTSKVCNDLILSSLAGIFGAKLIVVTHTSQAYTLFTNETTAASHQTSSAAPSQSTTTNSAIPAATTTASSPYNPLAHILRVIDCSPTAHPTSESANEAVLCGVMEETGGLGVDGIIDLQYVFDPYHFLNENVKKMVTFQEPSSNSNDSSITAAATSSDPSAFTSEVVNKSYEPPGYPSDLKPLAPSAISHYLTPPNLITFSTLVQSLAVQGRLVHTTPNLQVDPPLSRQLFLRGASLSYLFPQSWVIGATQRGRFAHVVREVLSLVSSGLLRPIIHSRYPLTSLQTAWKSLSTNCHVGKIVLIINPPGTNSSMINSATATTTTSKYVYRPRQQPSATTTTTSTVASRPSKRDRTNSTSSSTVDGTITSTPSTNSSLYDTDSVPPEPVTESTSTESAPSSSLDAEHGDETSVEAPTPIQEDYSAPRLRVTGLPPTWGQKEVRTFFDAYGTVTDSVVGRDPATHRTRYAFVYFATKGEALNAIERTHNLVVEGTYLDVKMAALKSNGARLAPAPFNSNDDIRTVAESLDTNGPSRLVGGGSLVGDSSSMMLMILTFCFICLFAPFSYVSGEPLYLPSPATSDSNVTTILGDAVRPCIIGAVSGVGVALMDERSFLRVLVASLAGCAVGILTGGVEDYLNQFSLTADPLVVKIHMLESQLIALKQSALPTRHKSINFQAEELVLPFQLDSFQQIWSYLDWRIRANFVDSLQEFGDQVTKEALEALWEMTIFLQLVQDLKVSMNLTVPPVSLNYAKRRESNFLSQITSLRESHVVGGVESLDIMPQWRQVVTAIKHYLSTATRPLAPSNAVNRLALTHPTDFESR